MISLTPPLPLEASEFLLKESVVLGARLLAFQPLHVALNPRVVAFGCKAREGIRGDEAHQSFLGALPEHTRLPGPSLLMAVLPVGQLPQLSASLGIGDDPKRSLERLPGSIGQGLRLARQDFLRHLRDGLVSLQSLLLPSVVHAPSLGRALRSGSLRARAALGYRTFGLRTH